MHSPKTFKNTEPLRAPAASLLTVGPPHRHTAPHLRRDQADLLHTPVNSTHLPCNHTQLTQHGQRGEWFLGITTIYSRPVLSASKFKTNIFTLEWCWTLQHSQVTPGPPVHACREQGSSRICTQVPDTQRHTQHTQSLCLRLPCSWAPLHDLRAPRAEPLSALSPAHWDAQSRPLTLHLSPAESLAVTSASTALGRNAAPTPRGAARGYLEPHQARLR